ncbi:PAS domain-containing protein [Planococcus sp. YIM B11945]|uniref:PAS domain-containing protein n=1 Tax=Planococcus sp. YIM B11945 TaxID=3435410 RepID=UPI003D7C60BE
MKPINPTLQKNILITEAPTLVVDENGLVARVNQSWIDLCIEFQLPETLWILGEDYFSFLRNAKKFEELALLHSVIQKGHVINDCPTQFFTRTGSTQHFSVTLLPLNGMLNSFKGATLTFKVMPYNPSLQNLTLESVLEDISQGFFLVNVHFKITYVNSVTESIFGQKRKNIIGKSLYEFIPNVEKVEDLYKRFYSGSVDLDEQNFTCFHPALFKMLSIKVSPKKNGEVALYVFETASTSHHCKISEELVKVV